MKDTFDNHLSIKVHFEENKTELTNSNKEIKERKLIQLLILMEWHNQNILFHLIKLIDVHQNNSNQMNLNLFNIVELDLNSCIYINKNKSNLFKSIYIEEFDEQMCHDLGDDKDNKWNFGDDRIQ